MDKREKLEKAKFDRHNGHTSKAYERFLKSYEHGAELRHFMETMTMIGLGFGASIALHLARFARDMATARKIAARRRLSDNSLRIDDAREFLKNLQFCVIRSGLDDSEIYKIYHECAVTATLLDDMEEEIRVLTHETQEADHS